MIRRLWPELATPWKRKEPTAYVSVLTSLLRERAYVEMTLGFQPRLWPRPLRRISSDGIDPLRLAAP